MTAADPFLLPIPATSLVGREREVDQVRAILNWPEVSLLTLTGPGGVGKTRLALEVARQLRPRFPHGVVFVALASLERPDQVMPAVARALGLQESEKEAGEVIGSHLAGLQMLLILDNFEHVLSAASALGGLLGRAPDVTVLVTSRERLRLSGEHEFPVPPLGLPTPEDPVGGAVRLFRDRARAVRPDAVHSETLTPVIEDICRQLDGLPLAIELAAVRTRVLGLTELRDRLSRRLSLLTSGARDLPARQQTLRAAIDWSYALLNSEEQRLLARLSVFIGGWTLAAAEAVCGDGLDTLSSLASLVDKSLVQSDQHGSTTRYRMLEIVREYALEQLQGSLEAEAIRQAHERYFLGLSSQLDQLVRGHVHEDMGQIAAGFRQLDEERPNILAALHHAAQHRNEEALAVFAATMAPLSSSSMDSSAVPLLRGALAEVPAHSAAAGWLWYALAFLAYRRGLRDEAGRAASQSVSLFGAAGNERGLAYALQIRAFATLVSDVQGAKQDLARCLIWAQSDRDSLLGVMCLTMQATGAVIEGRRAEARAALEEALAFTQDVHNHIGRGWIWLIFAVTDLHGGHTAEAEKKLRRVLEIGHALQVVDLQISGLIGMAALVAQRGRPVQALEYWAVADTLQTARNYNAGLMHTLTSPWLSPLLARVQEPELAQALQAGQNLNVAELLQRLIQTGLPDRESLSAPPRAPTPFTLTPREAQVLGLLAQGLSNKQIAARLGSGVYTVNDQVKAVFSKLGVNNRSAATRYALEHNLS
ncbi:MAG: Serine/threonine-protein kinase transcriptional regulatory protein PknK 3 [Deinococcus sp.]|nr:Serine/threonine-protein kinase transcriptional regulatory protein PknK 3 [Deinococcus sp.]